MARKVETTKLKEPNSRKAEDVVEYKESKRTEDCRRAKGVGSRKDKGWSKGERSWKPVVTSAKSKD